MISIVVIMQNKWSTRVNKLQLEINTSFYVFIYGLGMLFLLLGLYVKALSVAAAFTLSLATVCLYLSIKAHLQVTFYRQGLYYQRFLGMPCYVPFERIQAIKPLSFLGLKITKVRLLDSDLWFLAFKPSKAQLTVLKAIGYRFCEQAGQKIRNT